MAHNGGQVQVNLTFPTPYTESWAINALHMTAVPWQSSNASDHTYPSLLNSDGFPTGMPSGGNWQNFCWINAIPGDTWVLDHDGTATMSLQSNTTGLTLTESVISVTRREYALSGTPSHQTFDSINNKPACQVIVNITALSATPTSIRLFNKAQESLLSGTDATAIFTPDFLSRLTGFGNIRFMNWANCNNTRQVNWAHQRKESNCFWSCSDLRSDYWYGVATISAKNVLTVNTLPALTDGLPVTFFFPSIPTKITVSAVTKGNPTQFTSVAHGLANGDKVTVDASNTGGGSWNTTMNTTPNLVGIVPDFVVTKIDNDNFTLPFDSTAFGNPTTIKFYPEITISDGIVSKRCVRPFNGNWVGGAANGEWNIPSGEINTAVYNSTYDVFEMQGDQPDYWTGVPPSAMIKLANYIGAHPWFTFSIRSSNDFWTQLATLVKGSLNSGLIPYFESGNEVWNGGFWTTGFAICESIRLYSSNSTNLYYGQRAGEVSDVIKAVYGNGSDWKMVWSDQSVNVPINTNRAQGNSTINGGTSAGYPLNKCDVIAIAPYIIPPFKGQTHTNTYAGLADAVDNWVQGNTDTAFNWLQNELITPTNQAFGNANNWLDGWINVYIGGTSPAGWMVGKASYTGRTGAGLQLSGYEGGNGINGPGAGGGTGIAGSSADYPVTATSGRAITLRNLQDFYWAFLRSNQAAMFVQSYLRRMMAAGMVFPSQFDLAEPWTTTGTWGAYQINDFTASSTKQFDVLRLVNNHKRRFLVKT